MKLCYKLCVLLSLIGFVPVVFGGTVITNNLPANTAIVNIDARIDGAATYNGDQSLWFHPFFSSPSTQLVQYAVQPGTYSFRVINPADATQMFPALTGVQTNQMFTAWTYSSPWLEDYLVFPSAAATDFAIPQLFDGACDPLTSTYVSAAAAYSGMISLGYASLIRTGPSGRNSTTFTNSYTFNTATNLIFVVPDYALGDNSGGLSVLISPTTFSPTPIIKTWTGAADLNWFNANNWSPTGIPATNDTISINTSSTINVGSPVTIAGTLNWYNGTFNGQPITITSSGVLNLASGNTKSLQNTLTNAGTIHWFGGDFTVAHYSGGFSGLIENTAGAVFDIECDRTIYNPYGSPLGYFNNLGTIQKTASGRNTSFSLTLTNAGTINVQTGTLSFDTSTTIASIYNVSSGAALRFNAGTFNYTTLPVFNGVGTYQLSGGSLTLNDDVLPKLQMIGGTVFLSTNFQGGVITNLNLPGANLAGNYVVAGTLTCANGVSGGLIVTNGGTLNWTGGTITGPLDIASAAIANWSTGTASATVNVRTNGTFNLITGNGKTFNAPVTNAGTVVWVDGDIPVNNYSGGYSGMIYNLASGLWDIQGNRTMYNGYGTGLAQFHNFGLVRKTVATGNTSISIPFNNSGTVTAQTGTISFDGGGRIESVFNASSGAVIRFNGGGFYYNTVPTLNGPGAIQFTGGSLTLLNDVIPNLQLNGGTLVLSTNFQQGGVITNLNFGGTLSGSYTNAGTLTVGNGVTGTLTVLGGATFTWNNGTVGGLVLSNGATVNWVNGTMNGPLAIVNGAVVNWSTGTAANTINIATNGTLNLITGNGKTFNAAVTNAGTVVWVDGDIPVNNYSGGYSGMIYNLASGLWDIQGNRTMYNGYGTGLAQFHNFGLVRKTVATGNTSISIPFNNSGTVTAQTGTISFDGGGRIESVFNASSGAVIRFNGGGFYYNTVPTLNGPGSIQFTGGSLTLLNDVIPNLQMNGGTLVLSTNFQQGGVITNLNFGGTLSGSYTNAGTLTVGNGVTGTLTVLGGATFTWNNGTVGGLVLSNGATVNWNNGTMNGPLAIVDGAVVNWSTGTAANTINIATNGLLNLITGNGKTVNAAMTNSGTVVWVDGDIPVNNYSGGYSGMIYNLASGLWDIQGNRTMYNGYGTGLAQFHNFGLVRKTVATGNTSISIPFNNSGTVTAQTGTISFDGGGRIESVFNASSGAVIRFNGGGFYYNTVPTLNGPGSIQFTGGSLTLLNDVIPNLQMNGGTLVLSTNFQQGGVITNLNFGGTLSGSYTNAGTLTVGNGVTGTLTVLGGATFTWNNGTVGGLVLSNGATVNWNNGTMNGPLAIVDGAVVNWSTGTAANTINIATNGLLNLITGNGKTFNAALTNSGTVVWVDGDIPVNNYSGGYSGMIYNLASGLWDIQGNRTMYNGYGTGLAKFHNFGTVQKSAGTGQTTFSIPFNNANMLDIESGAIQFDNSGYAQTGATLRFGLNTVSATQMRVGSANMAFDGTLSAGFVRGQTPHVGDVFTVMTYGSRSGVWNHFNLPMLTNGLRWQVAYNAGNAQLQIVTNSNTTAHITGVVTNGAGVGVSNVTVYAYTTNSTAGTYVSSTTDGSGNYSLSVSNATWNVGLQNLPALGYNPVAEQIVVISGVDQAVNFSLQPYSGQLYVITTAPNPAQAGATTGDGSFAPGGVVLVSATANTNVLPYFFTNWTENGVFQSANSTYTFLASRDRQLVANFTLPLYTITVSNNPTTAGVVVGARSTYWGETNVLTAQPNFGYKFTNWTENGVVLSTSLTMSNVVYSNRTFVANYAEANLFHDVSIVTSPAGITTIPGSGIYTNGQNGTFIAPRTVITSSNIYTFQNFTFSNNVVTTSTNYSKTFATTDATNLQYVANYSSMPVTPQIVSAAANFQNPVPATTNLQLTFRFDRSMDTSVTPTVVFTNINNASPGAQPTVSGIGTWSTYSLANDSYLTPRITIATGMDGTNNVFISGAKDLFADVLPATNKLTVVVDATFPLVSNVSVTPGAQSAYITWSSDEATTSQADYGTNVSYGSSSPLYTQLVQLHSVTLTGLNPLTLYHFRVRSKDQAGNETISVDQTFTTLSAPDLQVQNLAATGAFNSGSNIVIAWDDANTGAGATYTSWHDLITVSNTDTHVQLLNTTLWYDALANGVITNGANKHRQTTFHIPDGAAGVGNLLIAVTVNEYSSQFESSFNNNSQSITKLSSLSTYPDLQVVNLAVTNAVLQSGGVVGIQWQDTNSGNGPITGSFQDFVTVSNSDTAQVLVNTSVGYDVNSAGPIAAGQATTRQYSFTLPNGTAGAGHLVISLTADSGNNIFENSGNGSAETNNSASTNAIATLAAYADLAPTNIVAPASASAGQTIQISWTDLNVGTSTAVGPWSDQVFISDTPALGTGQQIATFQINNVLAASSSLTVTNNVTLPQFVSGNQWLIVKANAGNSFFENVSSNNSYITVQPINVGATLALSLDRTTVSENAGASAVTATVSRNGDTGADLLVTLGSIGKTNINMPPSITIPAGRNTASFTVGVVDQHIAGGSGLETISASASGFPTANATLHLLYDDVATLTLTLNTNQVPENAAPGVAFVTITRNANFGSPLTVTLLSDKPTALTAPTSVIIPAGQASVNADLTPIDDNAVGDPRPVHLVSSATGFGTASATITVLNTHSVQLSLSFADTSVAKGAKSPATVGTVTRTPVMAADQTVAMNVVGSSLVSVPTLLTIPANAASVDFNVNVGDDNLSTGPQSATVNAIVLTPARLVAPGGTSAGITVLDTHGPTLTVTFADAVIAKGSNSTGTVSRNTPATNSLLVNLSANPASAVTLPPTVTIPLGQTSVTFTITGVLDNTQTGARKIAVTASANTYNSGVGNLTVSDIYYPDLVTTSVTVPQHAYTSQQINVSWVVANKGLTNATNQWYDYVYLSTDPVGQQSSLVAFTRAPSTLAVGASYTNSTSFFLPNIPGNYWVLITANGNSTVVELNTQNNQLVSSGNIQSDAAYRAVLSSATPSTAPSGTPIQFTGSTFNTADSLPAPNKAATIRILVNGTRRVFNVTSDANGNFNYTFQPLANEAGEYTAGADYPLIQSDQNQVSFALLGMQSFPANITAQLIPNVTVTNSFVVTNLTDIPLTGLAVTVPDLQGNFNAQFTVTNTTLNGGAAINIGYTLSSPLTRIAQVRFAPHITTDQGAQLYVPMNLTVVPLTPQLEANPSFLQQGILVGQQTVVSFDIINTGGAATGDLTVQLPDVLSWMTLSSPAIIPSIDPGGKATVTLSLNPPSDLPINVYSGTLAAANNKTGISVQFRFRATSLNKGDLRVTATDDYTYYVNGAPKVTNATVTLRDAITMAAVAQTNSDQNGIAYFANMPVGPYVVDATAPQHNPFRGSATIVNGTTNDVEAFMTRQLVSYQWTVVPTEIQDEYKIQLESVFETEVPVPNVVVQNPQIMMWVFPNEATQFDLKLRNEGLIAAQAVQVVPPSDSTYVITPLVNNIGDIPAKSEISVPCTIEYRAAPAPSTRYGKAFRRAGHTPAPKEVSLCENAGECLKKLGLDVMYYYPCGGNNVAQDRSAQVIPLCPDPSTTDKIKQCLEDIKEVAGSENMVSLGCNTLSAFLNCVAQANGWNIDPCVLAALQAACGGLTGGVAGAVSGGASGLPNCICAHIDDIPFPALPSSPGAPYDGRPDFGLWPILPTGNYYVSGAPEYTAIEFGSCADSSPSFKRMIVSSSVAPPKLKAPKTGTAGVCAKVRVHIDQSVTITRTAFRGTLDIDNGGDHAISNIKVDLDFRDATNGVAGNRFVVEGPVVSTVTAVDGSGVLNGGASGSAVWTFIPTLDAAPNTPATYQIGGTLSYTDNGEQVVVPLLSAPITVYPEARLDLNYFQQRDVYADDPFTSEVEPSEPFALGLIVKNVGAGNAHSFNITSGQPKLVENEKGLLINFSLIGTEVGNQPLTPSLSASLGEIAPGAAKQVVWDMVSTLQGRFISFDASFQHVNDLGSTNTSLINSVNIHELIHKVLANRTSQYDAGASVYDDNTPDFMVNDVSDPDHLPDVVYLSDGSAAAVTVRTNATVDGPAGAGHLQVHISFSATNGWNYLQIPDPGPGFLLASVTRGDGKPIALTNDAWQTDRSFPASISGAIREHLFHLFDWANTAGTAAYTVMYRSTNTTPPAIVQLGPVTPFVQPGAVSSVNITFSEQVDLSTFDYHALTLTRSGGANLITSSTGISVTPVSGNTYAINGLSGVTGADGNYQLTVNTAGIRDLWGNNGNTSASVEWTKGVAPVVIQSISSVAPNPRKTPVTSVNVTFSRAINAATFNYQTLSLTLNGGPNLITPDVTVALQSGSTFTINGLGPLTGAEGNYVLNVNAAAVQDSGGNPGTGAKSVTWTTYLTGPRISGLQQLTTNPRNIVVQSLDVTFANPIDPSTFDYRAITLTRDGGPNLVTSEVTVTPVGSTTYRVGNINWVQGYAGTYSFTVNASGVSDLAGNLGSGTTNETWQIILQAPPSPTNVVIAPDTGTSSTDGLTKTNSIVLSGTVGTTNLTVRVTDTTSGVDLGSAAVTGTNFAMPLSFTSEGQHHLKVYSVDIAQNVSAPAFIDVFIDLVAPTAVLQSVVPNPTSSPVTNLLVTFSEDINSNTLIAATATLIRDGSPVGTPTLAIASGKTALVNGFVAVTGVPGTYQLTVNLTGVQDLAGNLGHSVVSTTWVNVPPNQPPVISQVTTVAAQPSVQLQQQIVAADPEGNNIRFSLGNGAPAGASITTNGLFTWTPTCQHGGTTNVVTVIATDDGVPVASNSMSFAIVVGDCVEVQVGSAAAQVGGSGSLPVTVFSSASVTNLSFVVSYPTNRLGSWTIAASNSAVANAGVLNLDGSRTLVHVSTSSGQSLKGSKLLGSLSFTALNGSSASLPIGVGNVLAIQSGNSYVGSVQGDAGRVTVVGSQLLLEMATGASGNPKLILYGNPGATYQIETSTNLGGSWSPGWQVPMTNVYQSFDLATPVPQIFYRARQ